MALSLSPNRPRGLLTEMRCVTKIILYSEKTTVKKDIENIDVNLNDPVNSFAHNRDPGKGKVVSLTTTTTAHPDHLLSTSSSLELSK